MAAVIKDLLLKPRSRWVRYLPLKMLFASAVFGSDLAQAKMAEEALMFGTDPAQTHLFPMNPAYLTPKGLEAGVLVVQEKREASLTQEDNGKETIKTETKENHVAFGVLANLGAGAGLGLNHQTLYRKALTSLSSDRNVDPRNETTREQETDLKLVVELTSELKAGIVIRYLFKEVHLLGDLFLNRNLRTKYKTTQVGYGSGIGYFTKAYGLAYLYYPPLRGKADIYGEEKIIVEPGELGLGGYYRPNDRWTFGLTGKRWLHEMDDRATGTTAGDNQTRISLYGLDPDQYLFEQQLIMAGADFTANKQMSIHASIGYEEDEFNFRDVFTYNRISLRNRSGTGLQRMRFWRARVALKYIASQIELQGGMGFWQRKHSFPENMAARGAQYKAIDRETFITVSSKL